jgi:orotidine-5'-phosphate decarboxylase
VIAILPRDRLIVALDLSSVAEAEAMVVGIGESASFYKVGLQLIYAAGGMEFARDLVVGGKRVFLDAKLLDIDNTVAHAVENIVKLGVDFLTVHAYPGAMRAAVGARGAAPLNLLGVTALTSMDDKDLADAGYAQVAGNLVARRAAQAKAVGMDGIVCSPGEAERVRQVLGSSAMAIVTPGVRPAGSASGDQKRTATPGGAVRAGADYLVVGRPVTAAEDPRAAAERIITEIAGAISG